MRTLFISTDAKPEIVQEFKWGLVPFWAKDGILKLYPISTLVNSPRNNSPELQDEMN